MKFHSHLFFFFFPYIFVLPYSFQTLFKPVVLLLFTPLPSIKMVSFSANIGFRPSNFTEFYAYYLLKHRSQACRRLHFLGSVLGGIISVIGVATLNATMTLAGLATGVALCMIGDVAVQRIQPTVLEYPLWSTRANFKMVVNMLKGTESI